MYLRGVNIMEIERKFLVKNINELDLSKYNHKTIIQDYLYIDRFTAIRRRKYGKIILINIHTLLKLQK